MTTVKQVTWRAAKGGAGILDVKPVSVTMDAGLPENLVVAQDLEIPVSIAVDEALTPVGLVNVGEVRRAFDAMLKRVTADPKAAAAPPAMPAIARAAIAVGKIPRIRRSPSPARRSS
jgi:hypothetical protein